MDLEKYYRRQFRWRAWPTVFGALPALKDRTVLDLGCGVGDLAAEFAQRGAHVVGVDGHPELLDIARSRGLERAEFRQEDLRAFSDPTLNVDGIWCSFAAAYFPDLPRTLTDWSQSLRPGGWIALTEVDDMFGHEPLSERTRALFRSYSQEAIELGRYDFRMGRKLQPYLEQSGFTVSVERDLPDRELAFQGPAPPEVWEAWQDRLASMQQLRKHCGTEFENVRTEFLSCLRREDHQSTAKVVFCLATKDFQSGPPSH